MRHKWSRLETPPDFGERWRICTVCGLKQGFVARRTLRHNPNAVKPPLVRDPVWLYPDGKMAADDRTPPCPGADPEACAK